MIPQNAQLQDLPDYWQQQIRKLRVENQQLRRDRNEAREALVALAASVTS